MKTKLHLLILAAFAGVSTAGADQFQTGHTFAVETVTAQKLNDAVNKATAKPGLIGEQAQFTGSLAAQDEMLLRRATGNTIVRVTVAQMQTPAGAVLDYAGGSIPSGWLLCDGSAVSRTTYAALFAAIGTVYGVGDGSATFNLPDARGRVIAGRDVQVAAAFANRLTNSGTGNPGINAQSLGAAGGMDRWTLTLAQMPGHNHQTTVFGLATNTEVGGNSTRISGYTLTNTNIGGGEAHPIVQPTLILNKIIKF